jgi:hypothetical protein
MRGKPATWRSLRCGHAYAFGDYTFGVSEWERRMNDSKSRPGGNHETKAPAKPVLAGSRRQAAG